MTRIPGKVAARMAAVVAWASAGLLAASLTRAEPVGAPNKEDLSISLAARKVVRGPDGQEELQPAERAFPGEIVQYDALYLNQSRQPLRNLEPTLPIPRGMTYVPGSARPAPVQASLDGKTFEPLPIKRKVTRPDGTVAEQEVPATEYRALRWFVGDMQPGAQTTVVARARINPPAH